MFKNNIVRFFQTKYVFLTANGILLLAALVSISVFGTIGRAYTIIKEVSPGTADITIISVYIIAGVFSLTGIILTAKAYMTQNNDRTSALMCFGTLMFTSLHVISAHILSSAMITALANGYIDISYIVSNCPVFEMVFMAAGIIFMMIYLIIKAFMKTSVHTEKRKEALT
ncbi:MAG: hypothetical protein II820_09140 [Ruminiclostridium sp.]|nr:hypothetical protein [Ruminiclostridium sp.]